MRRSGTVAWRLRRRRGTRSNTGRISYIVSVRLITRLIVMLFDYYLFGHIVIDVVHMCGPAATEDRGNAHEQADKNGDASDEVQDAVGTTEHHEAMVSIAVAKTVSVAAI